MTKDLHCRFALAQAEAVEQAAAARGKTVTDFIRDAVGAAIEASGQPWPANPSRQGEIMVSRARGEPYIVIGIDNGAPVVQIVRKIGQGRGNRWRVQRAANWAALEPRALQAAGGAYRLGEYQCPPDLAAAAVWAE
jgi:hypothetical protein